MHSRDQERQQIMAKLDVMRRTLTPKEYARQSARYVARLNELHMSKARYAIT